MSDVRSRELDACPKVLKDLPRVLIPCRCQGRKGVHALPGYVLAEANDVAALERRVAALELAAKRRE